ncbi:hypothetical protein HYR53_10545, partial [Candidatus Acetothermia bacterium]|nr:hypothetical protein [Candidatus Acetothermia bacterium]
MSKKACIFIDGENFRYTIIGLFENFDKHDYLPQRAKWTEFFDWIAVKANYGNPVNRLRTYWYAIQGIDYMPYELPDPARQTEKATRLLAKNEEFMLEHDGLSGDDLITKLEEQITKLSRKREIMQKRFDGWACTPRTVPVKSRESADQGRSQADEEEPIQRAASGTDLGSRGSGREV